MDIELHMEYIPEDAFYSLIEHKYKTKYTCFDIANYFLSLISTELGDYISNLKLQKLVYLSQGFYLSMYGTILYSNNIEMSVVGPILPELYHKYEVYENNPLPANKEYSTISHISSDIVYFLNKIYEQFGQYSGWKLRKMIQAQKIFDDYLDTNKHFISHTDMEIYFSQNMILE